MRGIFQELVLERGVEIPKPGRCRAARRADLRPGFTDRDSKILGDAFREISRWVAGGISPVRDQDTVGSDISSATHGSSVAIVAGRNLAPTTQWARASESGRNTANSAGANARRMYRDIEIPRSQDVNGRWQPKGCRASRAGRRTPGSCDQVPGENRYAPTIDRPPGILGLKVDWPNKGKQLRALPKMRVGPSETEYAMVIAVMAWQVCR
jgi:hypothetical protein